MLAMVTYVRQQCVGNRSTYSVLVHSPRLSNPLSVCVHVWAMKREREDRGREAKGREAEEGRGQRKEGRQ